jgi:acetyl-CoA carboxylase biotin carboxyl carrier protein
MVDAMIDQKRLAQLIQLMVDNDLSELNIQDKDQTVALKRQLNAPPAVAAGAPMLQAQPPPAPAATLPAIVEEDADDGLVAIESPMVGTFYTKPNPDSEVFVKVGSPIGPDTVVCLIEAMKVFNEVQAEMSGVIERVLIDNGQPVEFGQKLYLVRPN